MYDQSGQNTVMRTMKKMLTSPLFLVGAIGYSVYCLFELLSEIAGGSAISNLLYNLDSLSGYSMDYGYMQAYLSAYNGARVVTALVLSIPVVLIVTGMWLMFASAKSNSQPGISVTGLSMIRVIVIIQLVFACLGAALLEIICIFVMAGAGSFISYYNVGYSVGGAMIFFMIVIAAVSAFGIIYYLKLGKTINTMKETIMSGIPNSQISKYVEIFCYVAGGVAVISALMSLAGMSLYGFLSKAGLATANIAFAIFQMKYRGNMERLMVQNPVGDNGIMNIQGQQPVPPYQGAAQPVYQEPVRQTYQEPAQPAYQEPVQPSRLVYQNPVQSSAGQEDGTTVLQYYNETSVLSGQFMSDGRMQLVRMTRQKTGETICISKPSFWIGKDAANVDYCITDNSAISRRHALVTIQNGGCYVRDNHSTNRVFINGQVMTPDVDTPVSDGDRVRLGDEEFIVNIS